MALLATSSAIAARRCSKESRVAQLVSTRWCNRSNRVNRNSQNLIQESKGQRKMTRQELIVYKEQLTVAVANRHLFPAEKENLKWELKRVIAELDELDKKRGA